MSVPDLVTDVPGAPHLQLVRGGAEIDVDRAQLRLAEVAQVVYLDVRGAGRSDRSTPEHWNLDTWADDLVGFCEALEIARPVVLGTAFGAFAGRLGFESVRFFPISAKRGDNVVRPSERTPWFDGGTLLGALETVPLERDRRVEELLRRRRIESVHHAEVSSNGRARLEGEDRRDPRRPRAFAHRARTGERERARPGRTG